MPQLSIATAIINNPVSQSNPPEFNTHQLTELIQNASEPFPDIDTADLDGLLERIGDARLVLIGEASHGTAEFYDMRARITRALIEHKGFSIIALEAGWPDAMVMDHRIRGTGKPPVVRYRPFAGFPSWLWNNESFNRFLHWLTIFNRQRAHPSNGVSLYGLDFYNIYGSIDALLNYLNGVDPLMASSAHRRYACLMPWTSDPAAYSDFMESAKHPGCGHEVFSVLNDLRRKHYPYMRAGRQLYFNALQNAILIWKAEYYYRTKHQGVVNSWNLRDQAMFDNLMAVLDFHGKQSKAVIWSHNTHVGDARATDMSEADELNLGQLVRQAFADHAYLIGMGTDHGTVIAASKWGGHPETMNVPPAHPDSYEHLFHSTNIDNFLLPLNTHVRELLLAPRLQRGIGSTYSPDPEKEMKYHYYEASLPLQFDEYIWFNKTSAVRSPGSSKSPAR